MHLPLVRTGISVKAGSSFIPPAVASASATFRLSFPHRLRKKKQHFFPLRFGVPRTRFGAVKPSLPALYPFRPCDVTLGFALVRTLPSSRLPLAGGVNSDIGLRFILSPRFWV
ncbi:hypothetical protein TNCV_921961 [Trichonephila clavipes]|nr:hypothetical protein TNCV_921961 [Trichonephila clavipes]